MNTTEMAQESPRDVEEWGAADGGLLYVDRSACGRTSQGWCRRTVAWLVFGLLVFLLAYHRSFTSVSILAWAGYKLLDIEDFIIN